MSRSSKGPRRDLQVLKRLKEASANPASLLQDGNEILDKANKIKGFLSNQKSRTTAASGKSEWLIVYQHLQDERESCERDLYASLASLVESGPPLQELAPDAKDCLAACRASADECRALRAELKAQVKGITKAHSSIKSYSMKDTQGVQHLARECEALREQMSLLREDLNLQIEQLAGDAERLSSELAASAPSALGGGDLRTGLEAGGAAGALSAAPSAGQSELGDGLGTAATAAAAGAGSCMTAVGYNAGRDAAELEALLGRYPLASESVKRSVRDVHDALQARFAEKLETWRVEWEASGLATATAGWAPEEHSQFVKLRDRYLKEGLGNKGGREAAFARIAQLLPNRHVSELLVYDDLYVASKLMQRRRRDAIEAWGRERRCFLEDSECFLQESARVNEAQAEAAADRLAHELVREQFRDELHDMRAAKQAEWEAGAEARAAAEAEVRARQQAEADQREQERVARNQLIAAYRSDLDRKLQEEAAAREAREHEEADARAAQAPLNKERVEWRAAEYQWKLQKQQDQQRQQQQEEEERRQRLERLRALVAPQVELDPARAAAPTAASAAAASAAEHEREEREAAAAGHGAAAFRPVHGYNQMQLYKDPKFKLMDALQRQGLHNTEYGRAIIMNAQTVKATRPDNLTFLQRAAGSHR